jgi:hypothetical protein
VNKKIKSFIAAKNQKRFFLTGEIDRVYSNFVNKVHHLLKRPDTYDLKIFVRTFVVRTFEKVVYCRICLSGFSDQHLSS